MIERLGEGPASVSELAQPLKMSLPAVVQHLAVLEAGGLVRSRKQGRVRTCELDVEVLDEVGRWIDEGGGTTREGGGGVGAGVAEKSGG